MKKTLILTISLVTLASSSAFAADLPSLKSAPVAKPAMSWDGFYAGLNAGGTWGNGSQYISSYPARWLDTWNTEAAALGLLSQGLSGGGVSSGFIGGGQLGYNKQLAFSNLSLLVGIEADIQGIAGSNGTQSKNSIAVPSEWIDERLTLSGTTSQSLSYIGTVRGRLGILAMPNLLIFGSGGLAYGGVNASVNYWGSNPTLYYNSIYANYFSSGSYSNTQVGWTAGGGAEWMFMPNWSAKVEYLYYDLGSVNYSLSAASGIDPYSGINRYTVMNNSSARFNGNIVRAGVNYHFNFASAPVVAKF